MIKSINRVHLVGFLGNDPEYAESENYKRAKFSLATSESYKDKSGEYVNTAEWHNIIAWGGLAEYCNKRLKKGDQVTLEGMLKTKEHEGKFYTSIVLQGFRAYIGKIEKDDKSSEAKKDDVPKSDSWNDRAEENKGDDWGRDLPF